MKKNKYVKQTTIIKERKIDEIIYKTILILLIALPVMQLFRMGIAGNGDMELYYKFHCGYLIWIATPIFMVYYLITIFKYHEKPKFLDYIVMVYMLVGCITTFTAINTKAAVLGIMDRYEGLFTHLGYCFMFLCLCRMQGRKKALKLMNLFLILGIIQSLYAFGQSFIRGGIFLSFVFPYMANAFCGNPNYLGSYLLLTTLLSIYLAIYSNKHTKFYITSAVFNCLGLVLAQSTIPYLTFIGGLGIVGIYTLMKHKELFLRCLAIVSSIFAFSLFWVYISIPIIEESYHDYVLGNYTIRDDITQIFNFVVHGDAMYGIEQNPDEYVDPTQLQPGDTIQLKESAFYAGRLFIWENTLKIVKKHIVFGIGYDNLGDIFFAENNLYIDKAHNNYLNVLVTNGIFGLLSYIAILGIIVYKGFKSKQLIVHLITWALIPFLVHLFFSVSVIEVTPYFIMLCGLLIALDKEEKGNEVIYLKE